MKATIKNFISAAMFGAVLAAGGLTAKSALADGPTTCNLGGTCCNWTICCTGGGGSGVCSKKAV